MWGSIHCFPVAVVLEIAACWRQAGDRRLSQIKRTGNTEAQEVEILPLKTMTTGKSRQVSSSREVKVSLCDHTVIQLIPLVSCEPSYSNWHELFMIQVESFSFLSYYKTNILVLLHLNIFTCIFICFYCTFTHSASITKILDFVTSSPLWIRTVRSRRTEHRWPQSGAVVSRSRPGMSSTNQESVSAVNHDVPVCFYIIK